MNLIEEIKQDISGIEALSDWLGAGGLPVHNMVAEFRAQRCAAGNNGDRCPNNIEPNWWERAKGIIAQWIRKEIEIKEGMKLETANDKALHMCKLCGCCMLLKVHTPFTHIREHTDLSKFVDAPDYCWIKRENQGTK